MTGTSASAGGASEAGHHGTLRRISDALNHTMEALHLTHHHHEKPAEPCALAEALLDKVKSELGPAFGAPEAAFCDPACLQRYLRARGMDVT